MSMIRIETESALEWVTRMALKSVWASQVPWVTEQFPRLPLRWGFRQEGRSTRIPGTSFYTRKILIHVSMLKCIGFVPNFPWCARSFEDFDYYLSSTGLFKCPNGCT